MTGLDRSGVMVAGIGNEYRRDDGVGPAVARELSSILGASDLGLVVEPLDLLGRWEGSELAVVVDAVSSGSTPGTVRVFDLTDADEHDDHPGGGDPHMSSHGIGLAGVLKMSRVLECAPARVILVAIEGEDFSYGVGLSPAVATAVEEAVRKVVAVVEEARPCV